MSTKQKALGCKFIFCARERKEGNVLFNDTLNTFYLRNCMSTKKKALGWKNVFLLRKEGNVLFNDALNTLYLRNCMSTQKKGIRGEIYFCDRERKDGNVLFNDPLNTFYLQLYGVRHMVKDHSDRDREREETCCCHIGYSYRLAARVLLYASSHRQDNTYHGRWNEK